MAASTRASQTPKPSNSSFTPPQGNNASMLLEKTHPGVRRSTPDSEALASSEDEQEHLQHAHAHPPQITKPARRTSWLNEVPTSLPRKASLTASSSFSPANSNPTTPATDHGAWGAGTSPGLASSVNWGTSGGGSFSWGTGIWNAESRKEPPARMTEVLHSPTATHPPPANGTSGDDRVSPTGRSVPSDSSIPFAIPLHPTPKTYRSQSYSVGQLDPESASNVPNKPAPPPSTAGRNRNAGQYSSVQRRSSRPSLLGELGHDPATLGRVREDDDDDDISPNETEPNQNWTNNQARTIEQLTLENAMLRQAATSQQMDASRFRERALSSASANSGFPATQGHKLHPIHGSVPEESDLAVEDLDELGGFPGYSNNRSSARRRFSEHSANLEKQFPTFTSLENRTLENIKRAQWQSSLGFGGLSDISQSRRHSFADIPSRNTSSFAASNDPQGPVGSSSMKKPDRHNSFVEAPHSPIDTMSYFSGQDLRANENAPSSALSTSLHQAYVMPTAFGRQQHGTLGQPHQNQQLFIVTFKCCRADVFYIQEDTGLQVKPGDLVIVEADRGTDLGTVAHANISWAKAKELKEHYAEEHYKWLMLFSRQNQSGSAGMNPNGLSGLSGAPGSAIGGMGPQSQHSSQESQSAEIKPKLIKRLAQNHEIQTLRDKEGNEAKAKRVCQQKVAEHRLNMEILDAEFQMDWKKLTFYYFADSYINFNSLVTDLFKIYKTRIWMSAINPASFVTPTAGPQLPSALTSSGLMGFGQDTHPDRRRQQEFKQYAGGVNQGVSPGVFADPMNRDAAANRGTPRAPYLDPYQTFGVGRQPEVGMPAFATPHAHQPDPFASYPSTYNMINPNIPEFGAATGLGTADGARRAHPTQGEWVNQFQGLSLGS